MLYCKARCAHNGNWANFKYEFATNIGYLVDARTAYKITYSVVMQTYISLRTAEREYHTVPNFLPGARVSIGMYRASRRLDGDARFSLHFEENFLLDLTPVEFRGCI